jgi:Flp pilus assembly secretin CpaC
MVMMRPKHGGERVLVNILVVQSSTQIQLKMDVYEMRISVIMHI